MFFYSFFYYICSMNNVLLSLGNIPVTSSVLKSLYSQFRGQNQKLQLLEKNEEIIRLKKGMYVVHPNVSGKTLSSELIANHIYSPSYVSMSSALRYYDLIPETVYIMQSMTIKHSRDFDTKLGRFEYSHISRESFPIGITSIKNNDFAFLIATPEKALCDLIANSLKVNLRYLKDAQSYLEEDIRMDMDEFKQMNPIIFEQYIEVGKKAESIRTILKLLKR